MVNPQQQGQPQEAMPGAGDPMRLANLPERLTVDAQGNALIFRGESNEADLVERVLSVVVVPNVLDTRQYFAGRAASSSADVAHARGLGEVQTIQTRQTSNQPGMQDFGFQMNGGINPATGLPMPAAAAGGASIVVDPSRGLIVFSGTPEQHEQMEGLLREFNTEEEQIVVRAYKLNDADSEEVADLITGLLENRAKSTETGSLLPGQENMMENLRNLNAFGFIPPQNPEDKGEGVNFAAGQDIFVLADKANNQVLVKAPAKLQKQFEDLIDRLDLRRPQVYLEAKIVSVTATDDFRLAFEYQLINAGGKGGAINFNNGLGAFGEDGTFVDPKQVNTGLSGLTAAIINSEYVPIIINALQKNVDARVLATPQLLVDDNEPSSIVSEQQQQTLVTNIDQDPNNTFQSVGEPQTAGTTLEVTPHISRGGYVRLEYKIEQSRFLGPSVNGIPADKESNRVSGDSVTVPQDTTVVVGGLRLASEGDTIVKIPLLGDIPIIGHLFRDTNKNKRNTTLYVFLTPRILQGPTIQDLTLLTRGPQAEVGEAAMIPELEPLFIEVVPRSVPVPAGPGTEPVGG
jgi:general secretion pathway protein D